MNWRIKLTVPTFYVDPVSSADTISYVPMYDQDWELKINFPKTAIGLVSFSGQKSVNYDVAYALNPIYAYEYKWTGLLEAEKDVFLDFIKSFNNSFQKFNLEVQLDESHYSDVDYVINSDTVTISKNRLDLYSVTLSLTTI